jgi:hypothetical protein
MVHSLVLAITTDGEHLTCGDLSLSKTIHFGNLDFIADCFGSLSLSPKEGDSGAAFMGTTRSRSPSLRAMIGDSTEEFYMATSGEGGSNLPSSMRHDTGATPAPVATTPWLQDIPATQSMTTVPLWVRTPWSNTGLPL